MVNIQATAYVSVIQMPDFRGKTTGGHVLKIPDMNAPDTTIKTWLTYYGLSSPHRKGTALVYKAVSVKLVSDHGMEYPIGGTVTAPDWHPIRKCGQGLHFSPTPRHTDIYHSFGDDARYLACEIRTADAVILGDKIKAPACRVLFEVNRHGEPIETKEEATI